MNLSVVRRFAPLFVIALLLVSSFAPIANAKPNIAHCTNGNGQDDEHGNCVSDPAVVSATISGTVFNDLNTNDVFDGAEPQLAGWTVLLHSGAQGGNYNNPVVASTVTDASGNYSFGSLDVGNYFVEEIEQQNWTQTTADTEVVVTASGANTVNFANVMHDQDGGDDSSPVPPTTITVDASNVVCTTTADLPNWGTGGHGPISATTAKDWVAAHASCSLQAGWSFEYTDQATAYTGDTTLGHVNGYTTFGPTGGTGSTTTTFTLGSTSIEVRSVLQDGFVPFTYTTDTTNSTMPSAQIYCATDALNLDNSDFIYAATAGSTYYCVAFNSPKVVTKTPTPVVPTCTETQSLVNNVCVENTPALVTPTPTVTPATTGGGNGGGGGGGGIVGGPLSYGYVNTNGGGGLVLGTSTEDTSRLPGGCSALLKTYMRQGKHNDKSEVIKLQNFLNTELGLSIPVTGFFGSATTAGVNSFQTKYDKDVLDPWTPFGLSHKPTGYVYKTTQHQINLLVCATLNTPFPQLP